MTIRTCIALVEAPAVHSRRLTTLHLQFTSGLHRGRHGHLTHMHIPHHTFRHIIKSKNLFLKP